MTAPVLYFPHGGGPLPLLDDPGHAGLTRFLRGVPGTLPRPETILVISAHWEETVPTVQAGANPTMLFDYYNFPPESYEYDYPAPGAPAVADRIQKLLTDAGMNCANDTERGFDHGLFVPLMLMYPDADIPCLQLSLLSSLDPAAHIALGRALAPLRDEGVLILGSGSPFHNMQAFRDGSEGMERAAAFDDWLRQALCDSTPELAEAALVNWEQAPEARYAHPREEHLLPLHVCFGAGAGAGAGAGETAAAEQVWNEDMMGYRMSGFLWA